MDGRHNDSSDEEYDDASGSGTLSQYDNTTYAVIALDSSSNMFTIREENSEVLFLASLKALYNLFDSIINKNFKISKSPICVLIGNEVLINFDSPMCRAYHELKKLSTMDLSELKTRYECETNFAKILIDSLALFTKKKFQVSHRKLVYYVTNCDEMIDSETRLVALNEAKKLKDLNITFILLTFATDFNVSKFYEEFLGVSDDSDAILANSKEELTNELCSSYIYHSAHRSYIAFYPFRNSKKIALKLSRVSVVKKATIVKNHFARKDNLKSVMKMKKGNLFQYSDQAKTSKDPENPPEINKGMILLSCSDRITKNGIVRSTSYFVQCFEKESRSLYNSFWLHCIQKNKVLLCSLTERKNSKIKYVELVAQMLKKSPVFLVNCLATQEYHSFASLDFNIEEPAGAKEPEELMDATKQLIQKMTIDYDLGKCYHVQYRRKVRYIKSKLLDEKEEEVPVPNFDLNIEANNEIKIIRQNASYAVKRKARR